MSGPPRRGDEVEAWIKRRRDEFDHVSTGWIIHDEMLDDYREHADTGTPLDQEVQGPNGDED